MPRLVHVPNEENSVDLTEFADLVERYRKAKELENFYKNEAAQISALLKEAAHGKELITVHGTPLLRLNPSPSVSWAQLIRANASITEPYMRTVQVEEFDKELFARVHPEIVEQFSTHRLEVL